MDIDIISYFSDCESAKNVLFRCRFFFFFFFWCLRLTETLQLTVSVCRNKDQSPSKCFYAAAYCIATLVDYINVHLMCGKTKVHSFLPFDYAALTWSWVKGTRVSQLIQKHVC